MDQSQQKPMPRHVTEHLANERTMLAWVRTSISVMALGIAINRFSLFLMEFRRIPEFERIANHHAERVGLGLIILGIVIMMGGSWHYLHVARTIDREVYRPQRFAVIAMAFAVIGVGGIALIWLFSA
ncbi:YidH family protein [Reyranella sp.]|uniref:YidH family protein n=1 Tax=Reyranella sp. TaxID=1929291 RepID=UPI003BAD9054